MILWHALNVSLCAVAPSALLQPTRLLLLFFSVTEIWTKLFNCKCARCVSFLWSDVGGTHEKPSQDDEHSENMSGYLVPVDERECARTYAELEAPVPLSTTYAELETPELQRSARFDHDFEGNERSRRMSAQPLLMAANKVSMELAEKSVQAGWLPIIIRHDFNVYGVE